MDSATFHTHVNGDRPDNADISRSFELVDSLDLERMELKERGRIGEQSSTGFDAEVSDYFAL